MIVFDFPMTMDEIAVEYRQAKDKSKQLVILADENYTTKQNIARCLIAYKGYPLSSFRFKVKLTDADIRSLYELRRDKKAVVEFASKCNQVTELEVWEMLYSAGITDECVKINLYEQMYKQEQMQETLNFLGENLVYEFGLNRYDCMRNSEISTLESINALIERYKKEMPIPSQA